jgi:hypothetical protein
MADIDPEWNPLQIKSNFTSPGDYSFNPTDFNGINPILLFLQATAKYSSPGLTDNAKILTPFVEDGHHFLMKS